MGDFFFRPGPIIWLQETIGLGHPDIFRVLTQLGTTWGVVFAVGLAFWLWGRGDAYALVGILLLHGVVSFGLNQLLGVSRPDAAGVVKYEEVQVGSFPSGHTLLVTVLWGLLYARKRVPGWLVAGFVLAVAVARLYLGVHYLADVLAGALGGVLLVWLYRPLWAWAEPRLARWRLRSWVWLSFVMLGGVAAAYLLDFLGDNPFKWHSVGLLLGGAPALLLERRFVGYAPPVNGSGSAARIALALLGLLVLAVVDRLAGESPLALGAALIALGALWGWLLAPAWLLRPGSSHQLAAADRTGAP